MNEPRRLRDGDGSEAARDLLRAAAPSRPMRDEERKRALARIPVAGAVVGAGVLTAAKSLALTALAGAGVGVAVIVAGPTISSWIEPAPSARLAPSAPLAPVARRVTAPPATPLAPPSAGPSAEVAPPPSASTTPPAAPSSRPLPAPSADAFEREVAALGQARAHLGSSPAQTLADLDAMAAEFPAGKLGLERELLRVEALVAAGRTGEARTRALALEPRVQGTTYAARLEQLLDRMP